MKMTFYGHACLRIENRSQAVLMDPWFSEQGAFFGSWFQFPENSHLREAAFRGVREICISHNHADHFDPPLLGHVCRADPTLRIHIPQYPTRWFLKRAYRLLPALANRIVEHPPYKLFSIGEGLSVFFVPEESPGSVDSAMVCRADDQNLVNLNDSRLTAEQLMQIKDIVRHVDVLALQFSGASEFPICYSYPESQMIPLKRKKRNDKIDHCKEIIDLLQPDRLLLFAGPPVFLDPTLRRFNDASPTSVFPDQLDMLKELERNRPDLTKKSYFLLPGEDLCDTFLWKAVDRRSSRLFPYTHKEQYIEDYAKRRASSLGFDKGELADDKTLLEHFQRMATLSPYISNKIEGEITFVIQGASQEKTVTVDFVLRQARFGSSKNPLYVLTAPASAVNEVLQGSKTWDDIFLSLRMSFDERADQFVAHMKPLLRYMDAPLFKELEIYEKKLRGESEAIPMIEIAASDETFRIQKHCPHAGTDLEYHGRVDPDGTITCLAHRFCFDLRSGDCKNAKGYRLKVERSKGREVVKQE